MDRRPYNITSDGAFRQTWYLDDNPGNVPAITWRMYSARTDKQVRLKFRNGDNVDVLEVNPTKGQFIRGLQHGATLGIYTGASYTYGQDAAFQIITAADGTLVQARANAQYATLLEDVTPQSASTANFGNIESRLTIDSILRYNTASTQRNLMYWDYDTSDDVDDMYFLRDLMNDSLRSWRHTDGSQWLANGLKIGGTSAYTGTGGLEVTTGPVVLENYTLNVDQAVGATEDNYVLTYDDGTGEIGLAPNGIPDPVYGEAYTSGAFRVYDLTSSNVIDTLTSGDLDGITYADGELTFDDLGTAKFYVQYSVSIFGSFTTNNTIISRLRKNNSTLYNQGGEARTTIGNQAGGVNRATLSGSMIIELSSGNDVSIELSALTAEDITVEYCSFTIRKIN